MSKGDWREEANQRLDVIEEKIEELQVSAGKVDALTTERDRLRARLQYHSKASHARHEYFQGVDGACPPRDSCTAPVCIADRQALAGQPERGELTQFQKGNIERARGVNRLWDKGQPDEGK